MESFKSVAPPAEGERERGAVAKETAATSAPSPAARVGVATRVAVATVQVAVVMASAVAVTEMAANGAPHLVALEAVASRGVAVGMAG